MDEVMKSLGSLTSDSTDVAKAAAEEYSPKYNGTAQQAPETNGQAQKATVIQVVAGSVSSPGVESASDTETDDSNETSSSESSDGDADSQAIDHADLTSHTERISSLPPV